MHTEVLTLGSPFSPVPPAAAFAWKDDTCEAAFIKGYANQGSPDKDGKVDPMGAAYGRCVYVGAARWAHLIENKFEEQGITEPTIADMAREMDPCFSEVDDSEGMGVSGYQYGAIVQTLVWWWKHGELMRRVHNKEYDPSANDVPNAVVNPAIITVTGGH